MTVPSAPIIDAQVHAYERNHPQRPWVGHLHGPAEVTGDDMVAAMDAVGVDGALLISPWSLYRFDASYARDVYAKHGARFGLIKPFDPASPSVSEEIAEWARTPGAVGARIVLWHDHVIDARDPGLARILAAGAAQNLPINILAWDKLDLFAALARAHPDTQLVLDHLGLRQNFEAPPPAQPFAALDEVLALANFDNVVIKVTGAGTLSHQGYPFADVHAPLARIFDAYGFARCLWGTDWTRATAFLDYAEGVELFRTCLALTDSERAALMGGTLTRVYRWAPSKGK